MIPWLNVEIRNQFEDLGLEWDPWSNKDLPLTIPQDLREKIAVFRASRDEDLRKEITIYDIRLTVNNDKQFKFRGQPRPSVEDLDNKKSWFIRVNAFGDILMKGKKVRKVLYQNKSVEQVYNRFIEEIVEEAILYVKRGDTPVWAGGPKVGKYGP